MLPNAGQPQRAWYDVTERAKASCTLDDSSTPEGSMSTGFARVAPSCKFVALIVFAAVSACNDTTQLAPISSNSNTAHASADAPEWQAFGADVELTITRPGAERRTLRHRLERRLGPDDVWRTRITPLRPHHIASEPRAAGMAAATEFTPDGAVSGVFDREGRALAPEPIVNAMESPDGGKASVKPRLTVPPYPVASRRRERSSPQPHAWLDEHILTPAAAARTAARLESGMQRSPGTTAAIRYVRPGNLRVEIEFDPVVGGMVEESAFKADTRVYYARYSYSRFGDGPPIRTGVRREVILDGTGAPTVIEEKFTNVSLTPRGN